jgi:hypothetical protein
MVSSFIGFTTLVYNVGLQFTKDIVISPKATINTKTALKNDSGFESLEPFPIIKI